MERERVRSSMKRFMLAVVVGMGLAGSVARAAEPNNVNVRYWVGSGSNQALVVVDFDTGANYAFGYRWDGNARAWDAMMALDAGGALDANFMNYGAAHFVTDFHYPGAADGDGLSGYTGSLSGYLGWGMFVSTDGNTWTVPGSEGVDDVVLTDGGWMGWSWTAFDDNWNAVRLPTTPLATPEPATLAVLALGGLAMTWRRRRAARSR
jgi:hypothetical protein